MYSFYLMWCGIIGRQEYETNKHVILRLKYNLVPFK